MKSFFYIILAFFFIGCTSDALDRSKAGNIIANFYDYPIVEIVTIRADDAGLPSDIESQLVDQGYLYRETSLDNEGANEYHLTEKGMTFHLSKDPGGIFNMIGNDLTFNEVTGIRTLEGDKKAIVDFTEKRSNISPFGKISAYKEADLVEKQVSMELYDDGWRITTNKGEVSITAKNPTSDSHKDISDETTGVKTSTTENDESDEDEGEVEDESLGESSASFFLLKKAFSEDGAYLVEVDYIGEDGTNNNPKLRTFQINNDFNTLNMCGRFPNSGKIKNFDDLIAMQKDSLKLFIVVVDNIVSCIEIAEVAEVAEEQPKPIENIALKPKSDSAKQTPDDSINLKTKDTTRQQVIDTTQQQLKDTIPKAPKN